MLENILAATAPLSFSKIAATPNDRSLAEMTRRIFYAGFSSQVIDDKWPAFERVITNQPEKIISDRVAHR